MSYRLAPCIALTLAVLLPLPGAAADLQDLNALGWLAGCWQGEGGGGENQECWLAPAGDMMLGVSRVISERGTMFEFLRIAPHEDGIAYFASPRGKSAVAFPLVESGDGLAVFADPAHDFPQRITYRRTGDTMTARVEARQDGEWQGFDVSWHLTDGGWPVSAPSQPAGVDLAQQVRDVETAFAKTMADRDHAAFETFLSDEAIFLSSSTTRGKEEVAARWQRYFEEPEAPFSWQPETVEVLASGKLALSTGPVRNSKGKLFSRYTSIWRQEAPGQWRVIFDKGNKTCADDPGHASEE